MYVCMYVYIIINISGVHGAVACCQSLSPCSLHYYWFIYIYDINHFYISGVHGAVACCESLSPCSSSSCCCHFTPLRSVLPQYTHTHTRTQAHHGIMCTYIPVWWLISVAPALPPPIRASNDVCVCLSVCLSVSLCVCVCVCVHTQASQLFPEVVEHRKTLCGAPDALPRQCRRHLNPRLWRS